MKNGHPTSSLSFGEESPFLYGHPADSLNIMFIFCLLPLLDSPVAIVFHNLIHWGSIGGVWEVSSNSVHRNHI